MTSIQDMRKGAPCTWNCFKKMCKRNQHWREAKHGKYKRIDDTNMANAVVTTLKDPVTPRFLHLALQDRKALPQEKILNAVRCPRSKCMNGLICPDGWVDIVTVHFIWQDEDSYMIQIDSEKRRVPRVITVTFDRNNMYYKQISVHGCAKRKSEKKTSVSVQSKNQKLSWAHTPDRRLWRVGRIKLNPVLLSPFRPLHPSHHRFIAWCS